MTSPEFAMALALATLFPIGLAAQTFEVATLKLSADGDRRPSYMRGGPGTSDPGLATFTNVPLSSLLTTAFDVKGFQLAGPEWLSGARYDIVARVPSGTTKAEFHGMLIALLKERLQLMFHREPRAIQGYELSVSKKGSRLREASALENDSTTSAAPGPPTFDGSGFPILQQPGLLMSVRPDREGAVLTNHLSAHIQPISALVQVLVGQLGGPVTDLTGLSATYDFRLEYTPDNLADDEVPHLLTAVEEQLGLKLEAKKITTEVLVIDGARKTPVNN